MGNWTLGHTDLRKAPGGTEEGQEERAFVFCVWCSDLWPG